MTNLLIPHHLIIPREVNKITDRIYIGTYHSAEMLDYGNKEGITHVLNCTPDPHTGLKSFKVNQLNLQDGEEIPADVIQFAVDSIGEAVHSGGKILVHCNAGISRSISLVCAFLMYNGFSWDEALRYVQMQRPQAWPHPNLERSIKRYLGNCINAKTTMLGDKPQ